MTPLEETTHNQRRAASPARSAIVLANAGSGKTRVLTNRVARLLIDDVDPQQILCITFTKAAAAEMAERLFSVLGDWALADDETLSKALSELEGPNALARHPADLARVRRLFARALETPGGLKIQTIHAFCERLLRRFPLEAGVAPGFTVIEEQTAAEMVEASIDAIVRTTESNPNLGHSLTRLSAARDENNIRELLLNGVGRRLRLKSLIAQFDGVDGLIGEISKAIGADVSTSEDEIRLRFIQQIDQTQFRSAHDALAASGVNAQKRCAAPMATFLSSATPEEQWAALKKLFIKSDGDPRGAYGDKQTGAIAPWVNDYLLTQEQVFIRDDDALKAQIIFENTRASIQLQAAVIDNYSTQKSFQAALDFDDLIAQTNELIMQMDTAWITYKLDQGIDHILIDEAQDTSPGQWEIIENLLNEFLSGAGARTENRSFFAVGDMKQSIYSFQGADAGLFQQKEHDLGERLERVTNYENVPLSLSFRTTEPVLKFVDTLFADAAAAEGLGAFPIPTHSVNRTGQAGLVEIWPLTPRPAKQNSNPWDAPLDQPEDDHPRRVLSEKVAKKIKQWLADKTPLESKNRPIEPGDIMILVQSRGPLFDEVIGALGNYDVPVAGADRLKLLEDPAIEDLLSFAKFAVLNDDDLSLAEILKSPLFGFGDDDDLFPLAYDRGGASLWRSLRTNADKNEKWRSAADEIEAGRRIANTQGPYSFFTHVLNSGFPSGRARFYKRMSPAVGDAINELLRRSLEFESQHPRSLRAFITWFEQSAGDIKREMDRTDDAVRVMTVHGAKGLEAKIVFLLDAHRPPNLRYMGPVFDVPNGDGALLPVLASDSKSDAEAIANARREKKQKMFEEYRRLLYVAATRAEDRLYICGIQLGNQKSPRAKETGEKSWHALAEDAFDRLGDMAVSSDEPLWEGSDEPVRTLQRPQTVDVKDVPQQQTSIPAPTPDWLFTPAKTETQRLRLAPSRLAADAEDDATPSTTAAHSPTDHDRYFRGRVLHRLLELLPEIALHRQSEAADRLLARLAPDIQSAERSRWRDEALAVLRDPSFAPVFGPGSRAEVSIAGTPKGARPGLHISGQIDRLIVDDQKILVVDYKTNRPPPKTVAETASAYVTQMAAYRGLLQEIYPDHEIKSALLWTFEARLTPLPDDMLDHAFARYLAPG